MPNDIANNMDDTIHQLEKELKELREENINIKNDNERLRDCVDSCVLNGELDYAELAEAKRLLKAAVEDLYNSVNDVHCKYCSKWHTDQCQGTSHLDCYIENKFKWRHEAEALALIGEGTNVPASKDGDTNG